MSAQALLLVVVLAAFVGSSGVPLVCRNTDATIANVDPCTCGTVNTQAILTCNSGDFERASYCYVSVTDQIASCSSEQGIYYKKINTNNCPNEGGLAIDSARNCREAFNNGYKVRDTYCIDGEGAVPDPSSRRLAAPSQCPEYVSIDVDYLASGDNIPGCFVVRDSTGTNIDKLYFNRDLKATTSYNTISEGLCKMFAGCLDTTGLFPTSRPCVCTPTTGSNVGTSEVCDNTGANRKTVCASTGCICAAGYYENTGDQVCYTCEGNEFSEAGASAGAMSTACNRNGLREDNQDTSGNTDTPCPTGTWVDSNNRACTGCPTGWYSDKLGSAECTVCVNGGTSAAGSTTASDCSGCSIGYADGGSGTCAVCPVGRYMDEVPTSGQACKACGPGKFLSDGGTASNRHDEESDCQKCPSLSISDREGGSQYCSPCDAGRYQSTIDESLHKYECVDCIKGRYAAALGSPQCDACPAGYNTGLDEQSRALVSRSFCIPCSAGLYQDVEGQESCKECLGGKFTGGSASTFCTNCDSGRAYDTIKATVCPKCQAGKYQDQTGQQLCKDCQAGQFNAVPASTFCTNCESGRAYATTRATVCSKCQAGTYQDQTGQELCKDCVEGKFREEPEGISCTDCQIGRAHDDTKEAVCQQCGAGYYQDKTGQSLCKSCIRGQYSKLPRQSSCTFCPTGFYTTESGSTLCSQCELGKYGAVDQRTNENMGCKSCQPGLFQDSYGKEDCRNPGSGYISNAAGTAQQKPPWKTPLDCSNSQYLNDTDVEWHKWTCSECPRGGYCSGQVKWSSLRAKNGYWRISRSNEPSKIPPTCFNNGECEIFEKCLFPPACLGAPDMAYTSAILWNNATTDHQNETCNTELGFRPNSRLCQTCDKGYSRTWGSQCIKCGENQDYSRVIFLFSFGGCLALIFFGALVGLRKKAFALDGKFAF
jgi:hypothetical protein